MSWENARMDVASVSADTPVIAAAPRSADICSTLPPMIRCSFMDSPPTVSKDCTDALAKSVTFEAMIPTDTAAPSPARVLPNPDAFDPM